MLGAIDDAHPAPAEDGLDPIAGEFLAHPRNPHKSTLIGCAAQRQWSHVITWRIEIRLAPLPKEKGPPPREGPSGDSCACLVLDVDAGDGLRHGVEDSLQLHELHHVAGDL